MAAPPVNQVRFAYNRLRQTLQHIASNNLDTNNRLPFDDVDILLACRFFLHPAPGEMVRLRARFGFQPGESVQFLRHWQPYSYGPASTSIDGMLSNVSAGPIHERAPQSSGQSAPNARQATSATPTRGTHLSNSRTPGSGGQNDTTNAHANGQRDHPAMRPQQASPNSQQRANQAQRSSRSQGVNDNSSRTNARPAFVKNVTVFIGWSRPQMRSMRRTSSTLEEASSRRYDRRAAVVASFDSAGRFRMRVTDYNMDNLCTMEALGRAEAIPLLDGRGDDDWITFDDVIKSSDFENLNYESVCLEVARRTRLPIQQRYRRWTGNPSNIYNLLYNQD